MTRLQEAVIEQLALRAGRACVAPPDTFGGVRVVTPNGACVLIAPAGHVTPQMPDFGIDWTQ